MGEQVIITISREFGSAGHEIGEKLAKELGINFYDRALLDDLYEKYNLEKGTIEKYDEKPRKHLLSRTVRGYSNSLEDMVFDMQSNYILEKAKAGESFVLVGRCGEKILADYENHISFFILGNKEEKISRVMNIYELNREEAYEKMKRHDKKRKAYHNSRCESKWGDSRGYELCINTSLIGVDQSVKVLAEYVNCRRDKMN